VTLQALLKEAEEAKRALTERSKTRLVYTHRGRPVGLSLSRAEFEDLTADLLERTRVTTKLVLSEAGLEWAEVDKLLLSGGSSRMPQVARMLRDLSGQEPDRSLSPDQAVSHGAALYHGILRADRTGDARTGTATTKVVNVNAHSLGLVTKSASLNRLHNSILVPRNTPLPHTGSQVFWTSRAGQERILMRIVEGESPDPAACIPLGSFAMEPLPSNLPVRTPVALEYTYDVSGRINVRSKIDIPALQTEVRIARRGATVGRKIDDWALDLLNQSDPDDTTA
jgi:molecular chaperone DnaK